MFDLCRESPLPRKPGPGRQRLTLADMLFSAAFKVFSTVSGRRFMSDLTDAHAKGYIAKVPHFNSIFNYLEMPEFYDPPPAHHRIEPSAPLDRERFRPR